AVGVLRAGRAEAARGDGVVARRGVEDDRGVGEDDLVVDVGVDGGVLGAPSAVAAGGEQDTDGERSVACERVGHVAPHSTPTIAVSSPIGRDVREQRSHPNPKLASATPLCYVPAPMT